MVPIVCQAKTKNRNSSEFLQQTKMNFFPLIRREIFSGSEGGAGIPFPPTPFPSRPARAEKFFTLPCEARQSKFGVRILLKMRSDFVQQTPPY
jgi:hypothetical protein